ncbi:hypothetical protein H2204_009945 [Knufia peltigerae]|nr:hypothetical protein H2204_009945 [Knufia peltigerae]
MVDAVFNLADLSINAGTYPPVVDESSAQFFSEAPFMLSRLPGGSLPLPVAPMSSQNHGYTNYHDDRGDFFTIMAGSKTPFLNPPPISTWDDPANDAGVIDGIKHLTGIIRAQQYNYVAPLASIPENVTRRSYNGTAIDPYGTRIVQSSVSTRF